MWLRLFMFTLWASLGTSLGTSVWVSAATAQLPVSGGDSASAVDVSDTLYGTSDPAVRDLIRAGRRAVALHQLEQGAMTFERAIRLQPENPVLWYSLARLRYRQSAWGEVSSLCSRAVQLAGSNATIAARGRQLADAARQNLSGSAVALEDLDLADPGASVADVASPQTDMALDARPGLNAVALPAPSTPAPANPSTGGTTVVAQPTVTARAADTVIVPGPATPSNNRAQPIQRPSVTPRTTVRTPESPVWPSSTTGEVEVVARPQPAQPDLAEQTPSVRRQPTPRPVPVITPEPAAPTSVQPAPDRQVAVVDTDSMVRDRSFSHYGHRSRSVPARYLPPPGLCRLWFDGRDPSVQPPAENCDVLRRDVPRNARLIVGEQRYDLTY